MRRLKPNRVAASAPVAGWWLNFVAGLVPVLAGLVVLAVDWFGVLRADSPLWTGLGNLGFLYSSLDAGVRCGVAVCVVARFGLRGRRRWVWWFPCFCFVWIGVPDSVMTTRF